MKTWWELVWEHAKNHMESYCEWCQNPKKVPKTLPILKRISLKSRLFLCIIRASSPPMTTWPHVLQMAVPIFNPFSSWLKASNQHKSGLVKAQKSHCKVCQKWSDLAYDSATHQCVINFTLVTNVSMLSSMWPLQSSADTKSWVFF